MQSNEMMVNPQWEVDPISGYIFAHKHLYGHGMVTDNGVLIEQEFSPSRKEWFIRSFKKFYPNVYKACVAVGISTVTYRNHYNADPLFRNHCDSVKDSFAYELKDYSMTLAKTKPMAVIDRMASLKVLLPDEYNPTTKIAIDHNTHIDEETANRRRSKLNNVIDAEIVREGMVARDNPGDERVIP
jgi:hypothetical protein